MCVTKGVADRIQVDCVHVTVCNIRQVMEPLIQTLVEKVKTLQVKETQEHQTNLEMKKELHQLQKKMKSHEEKEPKKNQHRSFM